MEDSISIKSKQIDVGGEELLESLVADIDVEEPLSGLMEIALRKVDGHCVSAESVHHNPLPRRRRVDHVPISLRSGDRVGDIRAGSSKTTHCIRRIRNPRHPLGIYVCRGSTNHMERRPCGWSEAGRPR